MTFYPPDFENSAAGTDLRAFRSGPAANIINKQNIEEKHGCQKEKEPEIQKTQ
jgi:hypothetical protein